MAAALVAVVPVVVRTVAQAAALVAVVPVVARTVAQAAVPVAHKHKQIKRWHQHQVNHADSCPEERP